MSPTTIYLACASGAAAYPGVQGVGGGVPGVVGRGWAREGYTGYPPSTIPGSQYRLYLRYIPTYGQMKAILGQMMRFLR